MKQKAINNLFLVVMGIMPLACYPFGSSFHVLNSKLVMLASVSIIFTLVLIFLNKEKPKIRIETEEKLLFSYLIYISVASFFAMHIPTSFLGSTYRKDGVIVFIGYTLIFLIAKNVKNMSRKALLFFSVSSTIIALLGIIQFFDLDPEILALYSSSWNRRAFSLMGNPNFLASYITLAIPISVYFYIHRKKVIGLYIFAILFMCLLATNTRGGWVAFIIYMPIYAFISISKRKSLKKKWIIVLLVVIIVALIFLYLTNFALLERFFSIGDDISDWVVNDDDTGGSNRIYVWKKSVELIEKRPIFGYGLDNMYIGMRKYFYDEIVEKFGRYRLWDKAHNEFLNIAVSSGIPALLIYLGFLGYVLTKGYRYAKTSNLHLAVFISVIAYLIQAQFNIEMVMVHYIFMAMLGMLCHKRHLQVGGN